MEAAMFSGTQTPEEETDGKLNETEELVAEPGVVVFTSKVHNLILTMFPELRTAVGGGERPVNAGGFRLEFRNHILRVDDRLRREYKSFVTKHGHHSALDEADLEEMIEQPLEDRLRAHPCFRSNNPDGFYEVVPPVPDPTNELLAVLDAFADGDEERLASIQDDELAGYKRPKVLEACKKALERLYLSRAGDAVSEPTESDPGPQAPAG